MKPLSRPPALISLLVLTLSACRAVLLAAPDYPEPTLFEGKWEDRGAFETNLRRSSWDDLELLASAPVYHLDLTLSADLSRVDGIAEIRWVNSEAVALGEVYLRLLPNLSGGALVISELQVDGALAEGTLSLEDSVLRVALPEPLAPGQALVLHLGFTLTVPEGEGGHYNTFSLTDEIFSLTYFYPLLAVYDEEGWDLDLPPARGDMLYADAAFYRVRVRAPADVAVVASGVQTEQTEQEGIRTATYSVGPARDFTLLASPRYQAVERSVGDISLANYAPAEFQEGSDHLLEYLVHALEILQELLGPYPYTEFDLAATPTRAGGVEYSGLVALAMRYYDLQDPDLPEAFRESLVVHEAVHQWVYNLVGNDQPDAPWLDEALTQYLTLLYFERTYGPSGREGFLESLWGRWDRVDLAEIPIGLPASNYTDEQYSPIVYGRGPLFFVALEDDLGQDTLLAGLRAYLADQRWGLGTANELRGSLEQACDCDLSASFADWVYPQ